MGEIFKIRLLCGAHILLDKWLLWCLLPLLLSLGICYNLLKLSIVSAFLLWWKALSHHHLLVCHDVLLLCCRVVGYLWVKSDELAFKVLGVLEFSAPVVILLHDGVHLIGGFLGQIEKLMLLLAIDAAIDARMCWVHHIDRLVEECLQGLLARDRRDTTILLVFLI